jgi:hypothetical protein
MARDSAEKELQRRLAEFEGQVKGLRILLAVVIDQLRREGLWDRSIESTHQFIQVLAAAESRSGVDHTSVEALFAIVRRALQDAGQLPDPNS